MSLSSTGNIKHQLTVALGFKGPHYFTTLQLYLRGQISRTEFDEQVRECLDTALLGELHNITNPVHTLTPIKYSYIIP